MAERVNPPPQVSFPQNNPFRPGTREHGFTAMLITALNSQRIVIEQLWRRTGGGDDLVSDGEVQQFFNFETNLATDFNEGFNQTYQFVNEESEPLQVKAVNGGVYNMLVGQWIKTTKDATLYFPQYAGAGDLIRITNTDGGIVALKGNGKTINGHTTGKIRRKERSIDFEYDGAGWRAV